MIKPIETVYNGYRYAGDAPRPARKKLSARADLAGRRVGRLTVIEDLGVTKDGWRLWGCICDCGTKKAVRSRELLREHTRSCGCLQQEYRSSHGGQNKLPKGESAFNQFFYSYKKSARERGYEFRLSREQFYELTNQSCYYCESEPSIKYHAAVGTNGSFYGNGIDRIDNNFGYVEGNVRPCCKQCNIAKGVLTEEEFIAWARRLVARFEHGETPTASA